MATVEETMVRVQRLLTGPMGLRVLADESGFALHFEEASTMLNIQVMDWGTDAEGGPESLVHLWAPVLHAVSPSAELFEWVAREGGAQFFGAVRVVDDTSAPGHVRLVLSHTLLGDFLDQRELEAAVFGIVSSADRLDDDLQARFGGKRFIDASE